MPKRFSVLLALVPACGLTTTGLATSISEETPDSLTSTSMTDAPTTSSSTTGDAPTTSVSTGESVCEAIVARPDHYVVAADDQINPDDVASLLANDVVPYDSSERSITLDESHPPKGMLAIHNKDGSLSYTPASGAFGCDTFRYSVEAGLCSDSAAGLISVHQANASIGAMVLDNNALSFTESGTVSENAVKVLSADIDDDGVAELLTTNEYWDIDRGADGFNVGRLYAVHTGVLLDDVGPFVFDTGTLCTDPERCWWIEGTDQSDIFGYSVGAGDFDDDGRGDLAIGVLYDDDNGLVNAGQIAILYGEIGAAYANKSMEEYRLDHPTSRIEGSANSQALGVLVHGGFDMNSDGRSDLIAADQLNHAFLILGRSSRFPDLGAVDDIAVPITGIADPLTSVHTAGDINLDGFDDLVIGAVSVEQGLYVHGTVYFLYGQSSPGPIDVASPDFNGLAITAEADGDGLGLAVAGGGDINGDGRPDVILGAPGADNYAGAVYVIFGPLDEVGEVPLAELLGVDPPRALRLDAGSGPSHRLGGALAMGGDFNGDGLDDLVLGAPGQPSVPGTAYLLYGNDAWSSIHLDTWKDGLQGLRLSGNVDQFGYGLHLSGDHDGDGFVDLVVSSVLEKRSWIVRGGCTNGRVSQVGTPGDDVMTALPTDIEYDVDVLVSGRGADEIHGLGDLDVVLAGAGDDTIDVAQTGFRRVDGGHGHDTLRLTGVGLTLDLRGKVPHALIGIEEIDLGAGNSMIVDVASLAKISTTSNVLVVRGIGATIEGNVGTLVPQEPKDGYTVIKNSDTPLELHIYEGVNCEPLGC